MPQNLNGFQGVVVNSIFSTDMKWNWFLTLGSQKLMGLQVHPDMFKQGEHAPIHVGAQTPTFFFLCFSFSVWRWCQKG